MLIFSRQALRELDRRAVEQYHIPLLTLMENAGRAVADTALRLLKKSPNPKTLLLIGPGNNGGDGLVAARHLHNAGIPVTLLLLTPRDHFKDAAAAQLAITDAMKLPTETLSDAPNSPTPPELRDWLVDANPADLLIDALFGTGLSRPPEPRAAQLIQAANHSQHPILAIDIPSGLDCDTGTPLAPNTAIRASHTLSFCGTKRGFQNPASRPYAGKISTTQIGAPLELLLELSTK